MGSVQLLKTVPIPMEREAVCVRHSATELILFLKSCTHFMIPLRMILGMRATYYTIIHYTMQRYTILRSVPPARPLQRGVREAAAS